MKIGSVVKTTKALYVLTKRNHWRLLRSTGLGPGSFTDEDLNDEGPSEFVVEAVGDLEDDAVELYRKAKAIVEQAKAKTETVATSKLPDDKFVVGRTYTCRSLVDHNQISRYKLIDRKGAMLTLQERGEEPQRRKVFIHNGEENCYPEGKYSLCPSIHASEYEGSKSEPKIEDKEYTMLVEYHDGKQMHSASKPLNYLQLGRLKKEIEVGKGATTDSLVARADSDYMRISLDGKPLAFWTYDAGWNTSMEKDPYGVRKETSSHPAFDTLDASFARITKAVEKAKQGEIDPQIKKTIKDEGLLPDINPASILTPALAKKVVAYWDLFAADDHYETDRVRLLRRELNRDLVAATGNPDADIENAKFLGEPVLGYTPRSLSSGMDKLVTAAYLEHMREIWMMDIRRLSLLPIATRKSKGNSVLDGLARLGKYDYAWFEFWAPDGRPTRPMQNETGVRTRYLVGPEAKGPASGDDWLKIIHEAVAILDKKIAQVGYKKSVTFMQIHGYRSASHGEHLANWAPEGGVSRPDRSLEMYLGHKEVRPEVLAILGSGR
jgi:hypothetical protein